MVMFNQNSAEIQMLALALGGDVHNDGNTGERVYVDGIQVWPDPGMQASDLGLTLDPAAGLSTDGMRISAAVLSALLQNTGAQAALPAGTRAEIVGRSTENRSWTGRVLFDALEEIGVWSSNRLVHSLIASHLNARDVPYEQMLFFLTGDYDAPVVPDAEAIYLQGSASYQAEQEIPDWNLARARYSLQQSDPPYAPITPRQDNRGRWRRIDRLGALPAGIVILFDRPWSDHSAGGSQQISGRILGTLAGGWDPPDADIGEDANSADKMIIWNASATTPNKWRLIGWANGRGPKGDKGDPGDPGADSTVPGPRGLPSNVPGPRGLPGQAGWYPSGWSVVIPSGAPDERHPRITEWTRAPSASPQPLTIPVDIRGPEGADGTPGAAGYTPATWDYVVPAGRPDERQLRILTWNQPSAAPGAYIIPGNIRGPRGLPGAASTVAGPSGDLVSVTVAPNSGIAIDFSRPNRTLVIDSSALAERVRVLENA